MIEGQNHLTQAIEGTLGFTSDKGKTLPLHDETATLLVGPRGWHLPERHWRSAAARRRALVDFGL